MSYLFNDPANFTAEMIDGFVAAHADLVRPVRGGVVRAGQTPAGEVALVIGGGTGHYPAFAGLVGSGLAHGAAMGNVFASPSAQQAYSVAREAASDAGVLFSYGNYAGDVLNFDQAQERLIADGIPCRTVVVTDDIMSASDSEVRKRRGIAGDLTVFRAAAWAAGQRRTLDRTWALASMANERTRTIGVAFSGCTLPAAKAPLFTVAEGKMALGMGIHGEPGLEEAPRLRADELAELLVARLIEARPPDVPDPTGAAAAVILNGLGSVKGEELFIVYRTVAYRLGQLGVRIVQPEVGEMVTSFDMAGLSLTMMWLTQELERAWVSPAYTPGYRKGNVELPAFITRPPRRQRGSGPSPAREVADTGAREAAAVVVRALRAVAETINDNAGELGRLDSVAGDGDHGIGMQRGISAAVGAAEARAAGGAGVQTVLIAAADSWSDRGGGTSGALWGIALRALAAGLSDASRPSAGDVVCGVTAAADAIATAGKASVGDKTMLDALVPFADVLSRSVADGKKLAEAWSLAAAAATEAAEATAALLPRIGRARPHAEASVGSPDPGATSFALAVRAVSGILATPGRQAT
jgi:dihydroxyacetone kinase